MIEPSVVDQSGSSVRCFTLLGNFLPLVRRDGICTGFFFFHSAHVMGPSGVSIS